MDCKLTSEWNHGEDQESWQRISEIIPVDPGSILHHEGTDDNKD